MLKNPSPQQLGYFDWIKNGSGSCILKAVAGAGKTTSILEGLEFMTGRIFLGAYNKKIADEMAARAQKRDGLFIKTMHGAGFGAWRRVAQNVRVDEKKCANLYREMVGDDNAKPIVLQLVSLAKQAAFGVVNSAEDESNWYGLIDHFNLDIGEISADAIVGEAQDLLRRSIATDNTLIDFDDMIYSPLIHKARVFEHDWVLIDEAQDTNASRRALALRLLKRGGRMVAVGDPHQAIYGFTGADADALDLIREAVNAQELPLTVSYRCPTKVVEYAHQWVSHIEAAPSAPEGIVRAAGDLSEARIGDAVLCRFNKPLLKAVYELIGRGVPAKVEGRDIGNGLKVLARRWKVRSLAGLINRLDDYLERETAKLRAKEKESAITAIEDKVDCLRFLIKKTLATDGGLPELIAEIDSLFADDGDASNRVVLSSIHKSKGREWHRVFWLQTGPSPWARMEWEVDQERNLCYVATTRAQRELVLVECPR